MPTDGVLIDCDTCEARDIACDDCVVSVLLGTPQVPMTAEPVVAPVLTPETALELDADERAALQVLADFGLVPPLRLSPGERHAV